ncbi:hypothetical protein RJ640_002987 [Escallonia rubra]|uniref:Uncharacterized protein n=1 Tax=Escallonia rubra TaxID=112253 RepID=A0AA88RDN5_9ASTE|nr:hypothetical protein RJ640_002987 [Escallonia rubra]
MSIIFMHSDMNGSMDGTYVSYSNKEIPSSFDSTRCKLLKQKYARGAANHGRDHASTPETATGSATTWRELVPGLVTGNAGDLPAFATSTANQVESQHLPYCFLRYDPHHYH